MKYTILLFSLSLMTFVGCSSETPQTIAETDSLLVGTWANDEKKSGLEFHSDHTGVTYDLDDFKWEVTSPGNFTVEISLPSSNMTFNYKLASMDQFVIESGSNSFTKKNSIDHVGE